MDYVANLILKNDKKIFSDVVNFDNLLAQTKIKVGLIIGIFETSPATLAALLSYQPKNLAFFKVIKLEASSYKMAVVEIDSTWRRDLPNALAYSIFNKSSTLNKERINFVERFLVSGQKIGVSGLNTCSKSKSVYYSCHVIHDYRQNLNCYLFLNKVTLADMDDPDVFFYEKPLYSHNPEEDDLSFIFINKSTFSSGEDNLDLVKESKIKFAVNAIQRSDLDEQHSGKKICLLGYFGFWTAYAEIAFQTFYCLKRMGFEVEVVSLNGFSSAITTDAQIQNSLINPSKVTADILIAMNPINACGSIEAAGLKVGQFKKKILLTMWETTELEEDVVHAANSKFDYLLVPSTWCINTFRNNGIRSSILLQPLGANEYLYYPRPFNSDTFTFLTAGRLAHGGVRKGIEDVLYAFHLAFQDNEKVSLKVKIYPDDIVDNNLSVVLKDKRISISKEVLRPKQFVDYLSKCHCYVSGSRSEGWGFIQQQAAMMGKPIITINYSGLTSFLEPAGNFFIPHTEVQSSDFIYNKRGKWGSYKIEDMSEQMRLAYGDSKQVLIKGSMNAASAGRFNFRNYYFQLMNNLSIILK